MNAAPLTVNVPSASADYGAVPGSFAPSYTGLENGDKAPAQPATCSTSATPTSAPGSYPITCKNAKDPNYAISYNPASGSSPAALTINKAPTTLLAAPAKRVLLWITFSATATRSDTGTPVSSKTIVFVVRGAKVCQASTNSSGTASCTAAKLVIGPASYTASFTDTAGDYASSSATNKL